MSRVVVHCIVILSLFGACAAQKHPCRFGSTSDVGHVKGVTVQQFTVIEKSRKVGATVFIPDGNEPLPSLVSFSRTRPSTAPTTIPTYCVLHGHWLGPEQLQSFSTE
jgi:hypothetical protein